MHVFFRQLVKFIGCKNAQEKSRQAHSGLAEAGTISGSGLSTHSRLPDRFSVGISDPKDRLEDTSSVSTKLGSKLIVETVFAVFDVSFAHEFFASKIGSSTKSVVCSPETKGKLFGTGCQTW